MWKLLLFISFWRVFILSSRTSCETSILWKNSKRKLKTRITTSKMKMLNRNSIITTIKKSQRVTANKKCLLIKTRKHRRSQTLITNSKKNKQFKLNYSHLICYNCEQKKHIVFDSKCSKFVAWQKSRNRNKKSKKKSVMLAAEVLNYIKEKQKSRTFLIVVTIKTLVKLRVVQCFIDNDAKTNFVSQSLIKNLQLSKNEKIANEWIKTIDEHSIRFYNRHTLNFNVKNSEKVFENFECEFYAVNMRNCDMILEYS